MFFTQEDYKKIEKWLQARSVKDTEFQEANPLAGTEEVAIVQDGKNRIVTVKDFANQLSLLGIDDFINVTSKYNAKYISLEDAIQIVPFLSRKIGQVITFLNTEGEWHIYQFRGESILQWNVASLWVDILESEIINSILPDEEDLTKTAPDASGNSYLKFKNKDYNNIEFSGLGRVFVRKNIKTLQDPNTLITRKINYLSQEQIADENTIYIIQYNHDLNGQTIIIPENSVLFFEGGTITNGVIEGQNTNIVAGKNVIFGIGTTITGTWNITDIYDYWFEFNSASGDNFIANDIIKNILALTSDTVSNVVHFDADRTYYFELPYKGRANLGDDVRPDYWKLNTEEYAFLRIFTGVTSNTHLIFNNTLQMIPTNQGAYFIFHIESKENIQISGTGTINGDAKDHLYTDPFAGTTYYGEWGHVLNFRSCNNIVIRDITIGYAFGDGIALGNAAYNNNGTKAAGLATKNVTIDGVKVLYARRNGISLGGNNYSITNVYFEGNGSDAIRGTAPMAAIDFENDYVDIEPSGLCKNVSMSNCKFKDNKYDVSSTIRDDLYEVPRGELVNISDCNFTSPLRLNRTNGLTFNNCHIVGITNVDNSIAAWYVSKDLVFNNCVFDELNPYLTISAEEQNKKFINPTYPEDIRYSTAFQHNLPVGKALKFTIPKPLVGEVEFTAFCSNPNYSNIQMPVNTTIYTFGPSQRLTGIRDIKIKASQDSTPRYSMYKNTPVFSYINYTEDSNNFIIYFAIGGDLIGDSYASATSVNIFLTSKTKFITVEAPVSGRPEYAGMYGGKWSELSAIIKESVDISSIPSTVTFPSKEMYLGNLLADLPTSLTPVKVGFSQFVLDGSYKRPVFWDSYSNVFRTADGNKALERRVTSLVELDALTAKLTVDDRGYVVYHTVTTSYLTWRGTDWMNEDGSLFSKVKYIKQTNSIDMLNIMFSYSNVIYKICADIDLDGGTLTIASGSTLDFQGGSFANGIVVCNGTSIKANGNIRMLSNITLEGSITNDKIYITWFNTGLGGDDTFEFRRAFKTALYNKGITITLDGNTTYKLSDVVEVFSDTKVELTKGVTLLNTSNLGFEFGSTTQGVYKYDGYHDIVFYGGGTIDLSANPSGLNRGVNSAFRMYHARNILIEGITIMNSGNHHMIEVGGCQNVTFRNMKFIGFFHFADVPTYKGECIQIEMARSGNGSDMPYFDRTSCDNITVEGCYFGPQVTFGADGTQAPYGLIARGIGCHDELNTTLNDSFHTNINVVDNTFDRVYQACVSPRIMDKCLIKGNRALNLQGYFVCTFNSHSTGFTNDYYLPSQNLVIDSNYIEQEAGLQTVQAPSCMASDYFNVYSLVGLENTVNVTITNNVFKNAQFYMIRCYNTQNTNISGNTFIDWAGLLRENTDYAIGFLDGPTSMMYPTGFKNVKVFNNVFTNANATNNLLSLPMNRTDVSVFGNTIKMASQLAASFKNMNNRMAFPLYTNSTYTDDTSEEGVIGTIALSDYPYNYSELQVFYTIPGYTQIFYSTYFNPIRNEADGTNSDIMCALMDTKSDDSLMLKQLHATLSNNNKNIVIDYNRIITHTIPTSGTPTATRQIAATGAISGVGYIKIVKVLGLVANNVIANS